MERGDAGVYAGSVAAEHDEASPSSGTRWRTVLRRSAAGALAVLVLAALLGGWWWRSHPTDFDQMGLAVGLPNHVGVPALLPLSTLADDSAPRTVTLESVRPHIAHMPPGVRVSSWVCRGSEIGVPGGAVAARGRLSRWCDNAVPAAGAVVHLGGSARDIVILRVSSTRPGTVDIEGWDLRYRSGVRDGTQSFRDTDYQVTFGHPS